MAAGQQVAAVTELLETILLNLPLRDILTAQQVNKTFDAVISGSTKLQRLIGLTADHNTDFFSHFLSTSTSKDGFHVWSKKTPYSEPTQDGVEAKFVLVEIYAEWDAASLPPRPSFKSGGTTLGRRAKSLLICQPPVKGMQVLIKCCGADGQFSFHSYIGSTAGHAGLTVGDLYKCAIAVREQHQRCHLASSAMHNSHGEVLTHVRFRTTIKYQENDPALKQHEHNQSSPRLPKLRGPDGGRSYIDATNEGRVMAAYIAVKQAAARVGHTIPTLKDFLRWRFIPSPRIHLDFYAEGRKDEWKHNILDLETSLNAWKGLPVKSPFHKKYGYTSRSEAWNL